MKEKKKNDFRQALRQKMAEDYPESADYRFWARFKKEGGPLPWAIKAWAPLFMSVVFILLGLSIYHSPEKNKTMLSFERPMAEQEEVLEFIIELDEELELAFIENEDEELTWYWEESI